MNLKPGDNLVPKDGTKNRIIILNASTYRYENQVLVFDALSQTSKKMLVEDLKHWNKLSSPSG